VAPRKSSETPIGEVLRTQRVGVVKKGLREMAKLLGITPPHLTDICIVRSSLESHCDRLRPHFPPPDAPPF
jgi:plasmid maintenance system antidote protein VapI